MLQLREFNLNLALVAFGTLGKDIENQRGAVNHPRIEFFFKIPLLRRRQNVIEHHNFCAGLRNGIGDLLHLAGAGVIGRIGLLPFSADECLLRQSGAGAEQMKLGDRVGVPALTEIEGNQHGTGGGGRYRRRFACVIRIKHENIPS